MAFIPFMSLSETKALDKPCLLLPEINMREYTRSHSNHMLKKCKYDWQH